LTLQIDMYELAVIAALTLRFSVLAATLPFLGFRGVPLLWRLALAIVVAVAVAPLVNAQHPAETVSLGWPELIGEAVRALMAGALLAVAIGIPFAAARMAGEVTGLQIGFAIVNTIDPQGSAQVSILGQLYYLLAVMLFFAVDAHHTVMSALVRSCTELPMFAAWDTGPAAWLLLREAGAIFSLGLQIAAPCVIVLLLVSASMGVIVKTVPHLNVLVVGFPVRIAAGLLTLGLSLVFFKDVFTLMLQGLDGQLSRLLWAMR
jgi:flagellar biosynthetic protein FliR